MDLETLQLLITLIKEAHQELDANALPEAWLKTRTNLVFAASILAAELKDLEGPK